MSLHVSALSVFVSKVNIRTRVVAIVSFWLQLQSPWT